MCALQIFVIIIIIIIIKEKPGGTVDYDEPLFHPRNQFLLQDANEIEDVLNIVLTTCGSKI